MVKTNAVQTISAIVELPEETPKYMISNDKFANFRCAAGRLAVQADGTLHMTARLAARANVKVGDQVRYYAL